MIAANHAGRFHVAQVRMNGRRRLQANSLTDFPYRRRKGVLLVIAQDIVIDFLLRVSELFHGIIGSCSFICEHYTMYIALLQTNVRNIGGKL